MLLRRTTCLIFIVFELIPKVSAINGRLIVSNTWHSGQRVNVICQIPGSLERNCKGTLGTTVFRVNTNQVCTVQARWQGNCLAKTPTYFPANCWCEQGPGDSVNYVYVIWADPQNDNGTWSCEKGCTPEGHLFPTPFMVDNSAGINKTVLDFRPLTCDPSGGYPAVKGFERREAVCVCDKNREIGTCGPCTTSLWMGGYCTGREQVPSIIALVVILVLVLTLNALYFGFVIHKQGLPLNKQGAEKVDMQPNMEPNMEMHQKMDMNTHQKKMHYAVESNDQKDEPSGVSSWDSETDQSEGPTVTN